MKCYSKFIAFFLLSSLCYSQERGMKHYSSGLLYSDTTMKQLEFIVDSLNLKFRTCELSKTYYSKSTVRANYLVLKGERVQQAMEDMKHQISFEAFLVKYPDSEFKKDQYVVKYAYRNYKDQEIVEYDNVLSTGNIKISYEPKQYHQAVKGQWIFDYFPGSEYNDETIRAFYFLEEFEMSPLADAYARMVQYSDCLIDTSTQVFLNTAASSSAWDRREPSKALKKFMDYVHVQTKAPVYDEDDAEEDEENDSYDNYEEYAKRLILWDSVKWMKLDEKISKQVTFKELLAKAVEEALKTGNSNDEFEEYVARYESKETALLLKRGRIVVGGCSMDQSPRIHAMNIAVLSAETVNWETFLRAHLDIMNDRFQRASDGSYAWAERQTYIRELEELDINVADLLIGISLRIENPSQNHYYGSIGRLGRALSETQTPDEIEDRLLFMIQDQNLDLYNRFIMVGLFRNYNHYLVDENRKAENETRLKLSIQSFPEVIAQQIMND